MILGSEAQKDVILWLVTIWKIVYIIIVIF